MTTERPGLPQPASSWFPGPSARPFGPQSFNPHTCLITVHQHGTYTLVSGTGKYAGISGHGRYRLDILAVAARSHGKCNQNKTPAAFELIVRLSGPVHL